MANTILNPPQTNLARGLMGALTGSAIFVFQVAHRYVRRGRMKKILRSLSEEQIADAGIDRSPIETGPHFEVDARLMSSLTSMR